MTHGEKDAVMLWEEEVEISETLQKSMLIA
jgi:hypothetical protein